MEKLTLEQQKIMDSEVKNLVISASAGSGKTYILIEKLKKLICEKRVKVERLLVLTFTKVASSEIKSRLTNALLSLKPDKEVLENLDALPLSDISTIDSFCEKIIKRNINKLDLDENFVVLDEKSTKKLKKMAFSLTFSHFSQKEYEKFDEIYLAFKKNKSMIEECINYIESYFDALSNEEEMLDSFDSNVEELDQIAQDYLKQYIKDCLENSRKILDSIDSGTLTKSEVVFLLSCYEIINASLVGDIFEISKRLNSLSLPSLRGKHNEDVKRKLNSAKDYLLNATELTQKYSYLIERASEKSKEGRLVKAILAFYRYYKDLYNSFKLKRSGLDFADIERFAKKLISNEDVKKSLQERYDYIFIDEYQDTNHLQESIIKPIAQGGYFTAVGDIKQGIYGFRNASMEIMQKDIADFTSSEEGDALYLNGNFRTDNALLDFINKVFEKIMTKESVGIDYKATSMLKGLKEFKKDGLKPLSIDLVLDETEKLQREVEEDIYDIRNDELQGDNSQKGEIEAIINRIESLIGQNIYDSKLGKFRQVEFGDIALLFRGRSSLMKELVKTLRGIGMSVNADLKESLLEDSQIAIINSLLKLTINFNDDISVASVMCSPFGNFSIDELALLRLNEVNKPLYQIVSESEDEKIVEFKRLIEEVRFNIQIFGVTKSLTKLFNHCNYYEKIESEKISKINSLFRHIKEGGLDFNVAGIISLLESSVEVRVGEDGGNAITVTTIHSTKGLEYPIVIICGAGESLNKPFNKSYLISNKFGLGMYLYDFDNLTKIPSPAFLAGRLELAKREFVDEIMIFYVAMTRAQNHLYIIGRGKEKDFTFDNLNKQNSYLKMIFFALGENLTSQLFSQGRINAENYQINIVGNSFEEFNKIDTNNKIMSEEKFCKEISEYKNFSYPRRDECNLNYKNSVTGIMTHGEEIIEIEQENLNQARVRSRESAILTGNAYHEALKIINFDKVNCLEDLILQSSYLKENLTEGYFELLDLSLIFKNIQAIKSVTYGLSLHKEREFILQSTLGELGLSRNDNEECENNLIIQGIVDLFAMGQKLVLIDYKYTSCKDENTLKERYRGQLELYSLALAKAFNRQPDEIYLLSLKEGQLIKL